ncbi:MAG: acetylornithine deacetylase [Caulobacterales bacterium]
MMSQSDAHPSLPLERTIDWLTKLVAFDTTSRNSNLPLIDYVEAYLAARNVPSWRVPSDDGQKANLFALVGPAVEGGIILSGHTDVVPIDGQDWASDPWVLTHRDGLLFGRGASDMKSFIALCMAHVDAALAADLKTPMIFAFSYDEEVGCLGAPRMIEAIAKGAPKPAGAIIGEPTDMKVVSAHKGVVVVNTQIEGREAHSSQIHQGVSAVMMAAKLMNFVMELGEEARAAAPDDALFEPSGTTITINKVHGGTAANILAKECAFTFDIRGPDAEEMNAYADRYQAEARRIEAEMKKIAPEASVTVDLRITPPLEYEPGNAAEVLARALTGDNSPRGVAYAAEAGQFQDAGFEAVICGPGSILQAHQPNEFVAVEQLKLGCDFFAALIARLSK